MRISLAISHTPWIPERVEVMGNLCLELGIAYGPHSHIDNNSFAVVQVFDEKAPNHVWSEKMWEWAAGEDVDWCLFLQDDTVLRTSAEKEGAFYDLLVCRLEEAEEKAAYIVGLHVAHPAARALEDDRKLSFATSDGVVGVGYAVRRQTLAEFLQWRCLDLEDGAIEKTTEDGLLALYALAHDLAVYHPLPALIDHNTSLASTYGNDDHSNRQTTSRLDPALWYVRAHEAPRTPHLGRFYEASPKMLAEVLRDPPTARDIAAWEADDGAWERRRLYHAERGREEPGEGSRARIFIAVPSARDGMHPAVASGIFNLLKAGFEINSPFEMLGPLVQSADICKTREQLAWIFLNETDATHMLFLDDDVAVSPACVEGMLAADSGLVCTPYPKRGGIDWAAVAHQGMQTGMVSEAPFEAVAYRYALRVGPEGMAPGSDHCAAVVGAPLGASLIRRQELQALSDACTQRIRSTFPDGTVRTIPALFGLLTDKCADGVGVERLSEDFSFCHRWRSHGGVVKLYLGPGSPVDHYGAHCFRGHIEALGFRRQVVK